MDHKEQIIAYVLSKIQKLIIDIKENKSTHEELLLQIECIEDLLRDYFNLTD